MTLNQLIILIIIGIIAYFLFKFSLVILIIAIVLIVIYYIVYGINKAVYRNTFGPVGPVADKSTDSDNEVWYPSVEDYHRISLNPPSPLSSVLPHKISEHCVHKHLTKSGDLREAMKYCKSLHPSNDKYDSIQGIPSDTSYASAFSDDIFDHELAPVGTRIQN